MPQEGPEWNRLREELRNARDARGLTLDAIAGLLMTKANLSKMESGSRRLTRPIIERYATLTGIDKFLTAFDYLVAQDANPRASPDQLPRLGAVLASMEVEQTITVGELVKVFERREVLPKIHGIEGTRVGLHFPSLDGRRPKVRPAQAYRAEIALQGWMDRSNYEIVLRFPKGVIEVGKPPYDFTLITEYELPTPIIGLVPSDPLPLYRMTITLPPFAVDVFELNGVLPAALDDLMNDFERGDARAARHRSVDASAEITRDFLDLKPALFYGLAWFPRGRASSSEPSTIT